MFTPELINETIEYFKQRCDITIDEETAELYLNSLADLFGIYREALQEQADLKQKKSEGIL